ncbi:2-phosphosulfolactate phosphatase [bacterium]|nr:MAG: 2-phosphosulfolactate phosphatase [bacterium]
MEIAIVDFVAGARAARGVAIVIDVFRAATVQCHAFGRSASRVIPVADEAEARRLKADHPDWLLIGERHARKLPGFDHGNSPSEIAALDLTGRTVVHTTHAGTQGLAAAQGATHVLSAALVNASATVAHVLAIAPSHVSIVRMGLEARERTVEDDACAELLASLLRGERYPVEGLRKRLEAAPSARKFFDSACDYAPREDFELCCEVDRFDFALQLEGRHSAHPYLASRAPG